MRPQAWACLAALAATSGCALPPKLEISNAGRAAISFAVDYHSRTVRPGASTQLLYSGKDFSITEEDCLFRFRGVERNDARELKLRWSGGGELTAQRGGLLVPVSKRCAA